MTSPAISRLRRLMLEQWIENAIALLDTADGDPDLEDTDTDHDSDFEDFDDEKEIDLPGAIRGGQGL